MLHGWQLQRLQARDFNPRSLFLGNFSIRLKCKKKRSLDRSQIMYALCQNSPGISISLQVIQFLGKSTRSSILCILFSSLKSHRHTSLVILATLLPAHIALHPPVHCSPFSNNCLPQISTWLVLSQPLRSRLKCYLLSDSFPRHSM